MLVMVNDGGGGENDCSGDGGDDGASISQTFMVNGTVMIDLYVSLVNGTAVVVADVLCR